MDRLKWAGLEMFNVYRHIRYATNRRYYRMMERKLGKAKQGRKKRQEKGIYAKINNLIGLSKQTCKGFQWEFA
jgi:hypothetical protein